MNAETLTETPPNTAADYIRMVEEIQRGENVNENLKTLCDEMAGVVIAAAQKAGFRQETRDIIDDTPALIYKAALSFDPNRGAAFAGYLNRKVGWFIGHEWQKRHERVMQKNKKVKWVPRYFEPIENYEFAEEQADPDRIEQYDFDPARFDDAAFQRALCKLDKKDRDIIDAFLAAGSIRGAGYFLSVPRLNGRFHRIVPTIKTLYRLELGVFSDRANPSEYSIDDNIPVPAA